MRTQVGGFPPGLNAGLHREPTRRGSLGSGASTPPAGLDEVVRDLTDKRPRRLQGLPRSEIRGRRVPVATSRAARLLGLSHLDRRRAGVGLLIPGCRSVHTFGMRFPLDLVFLDFDLRPVALRRAVPPRRLAYERRAQAVLELPAGGRGGAA